MKIWKLIAGIVSMLASALVLTSAITSYRDLAGTSAQPGGLYPLFAAAALLGLAGIVQVVFRDAADRKTTLSIVGIYAAAFLFFVITAIVGVFDSAGWIQILTFTIWTVGCAAYAYLEMMWSSNAAAAESFEASTGKEEKDDAGVEAQEPSTGSEFSADPGTEGGSPFAELDLPPVPQAGAEVPAASAPPAMPPRLDAMRDASWDGTSAPPRF